MKVHFIAIHTIYSSRRTYVSSKGTNLTPTNSCFLMTLCDFTMYIDPNGTACGF